MTTYYFAGGIYYNDYNHYEKGTHFAAVSSGFDTPYLTTDENGLGLTSHHSSLYSLSDDFTEAFLIQHRNGGVKESPKHVVLSEELRNDLVRSLTSGKIYD